MLEATSCSFAGLCFCLLAISAAALPSTFFCRSFLPLLLFGCTLFSRFFIPPQAKPVAEKQHRKRGRLKTETAVNANIGTLVKEALPTCCRGSSLIAVAVALSVAGVAGIIAAALAPTVLAAMHAEVSNIISFHSESEYGNSCVNGLGFGCSDQLGTDGVDLSGYSAGDRVRCGDGGRRGSMDGDRLDSGGVGQLGCGGSSRLGWGAGVRLGSSGGEQLGSSGGEQLGWCGEDRLGRGGGYRPDYDSDRLRLDHDSTGGRQLGWSGGGRLECDGGDQLGRGTIGIGSGSQLGGNGRNRLRCAREVSDRLGSDGGDRLGRDGGDGLSYGDDERLRVGGVTGGRSRSSKNRLGYHVDSRKSGIDGWTVGNRKITRKESGSAPLARMLFDKDNPADRT